MPTHRHSYTRTPEEVRRRRLRMVVGWLAALAGIIVLTLFGFRAWHQYFHIATPLESRVPMLDAAQVVVVRTPGGMLEVSRLERTEEFAWRSAYTCRYIDCSAFTSATTSRAKVKAHYVYRLPLAQEWKLVPRGDHYALTLPMPQLQEPVAFDTATLEIRTERGGLIAPSAIHNRERLFRELGPELAQRGRQAHYLEAQRAAAEQTVAEFARKWMLEQGERADVPVRVGFKAPAAAP